MSDSYAFEAPLRAKLTSPDWRRRCEAFRSLGESRDPRAFEPLRQGLRDPLPTVRCRTAAALGRQRDPRAIAALIKMLDDAVARVQVAAAAALKKFGKSAHPELFKAYRQGSRDVRFRVLGILSPSRSAAVSELLIAALNDPDRRQRGEATRILGVRKDRRAVEPLIAALDRRGAERLDYVRALGAIRDPRAFEPLQALLDENDFHLHHEVVNALRTIDNPRAVDTLYEMLEDDYNPAREGLALRLAATDLLNTARSLHGKANGDPSRLVSALAASQTALWSQESSTGLGCATEYEEAQPRRGPDTLRALEFALRDLGRGR